MLAVLPVLVTANGPALDTVATEKLLTVFDVSVMSPRAGLD